MDSVYISLLQPPVEASFYGDTGRVITFDVPVNSNRTFMFQVLCHFTLTNHTKKQETWPSNM